MRTFLATPPLFFRTGNYLLCKGRARTALGRPFIHRTHQPVLHHSGLEKASNQLQYAFVADSLRYPRHQWFMSLRDIRKA
jgi:hypothetical protein